MKNQKHLIIFEGISGSGKTTLLQAVNHARNFKDYHWHRFTATEWVYGAIENRDVSLSEIRDYEEKIQLIWPTLLVTLTCDDWLAKKRKEEMPNEIIEPNLKLANKLFLVYHNYLTHIRNRIIICTNDKTVEQCVEIILKNINYGIT